MTVLHTSDGIELAMRTWSPAGPPRASVVLVHGFGASKDDRNVVGMAEALCAVDLDVVSYDARGHGQSAGECTLGDLERLDVAAATDWACQRAQPVVVLGASMGAIAALRYLAAEPHAAGGVIVSAPAEWRLPRTARAVLAAGLTQTRLGRYVAARSLRVRLHRGRPRAEAPSALVRRVEVPLAIVHGERDRFIPPRDARVLHLLAPRFRRLALVPGMGHAFDPVGIPAIVEAVDWVLDQRMGKTAGEPD